MWREADGEESDKPFKEFNNEAENTALVVPNGSAMIWEGYEHV